MENWKQAFLLSKFELKHSKQSIVLLAIMLVPYIAFIVLTADTYIESGFFLFDGFFLLIIGIAAMWGKPKDYQIKSLGFHSYTHPYFTLLNQLAIPKDVLIKNRFVIYYVYSIPFHTLFLLFIYLFSDVIRAELTVGQYIAFSIIWMCFGIYWGSVYPVSDIGDDQQTSKVKGYFNTALIILIVVGVYTTIQLLTGNGVVYWTMVIAKKWPILSSILSLLAAYVGSVIALRQAHKKMKKVDYTL